MRLGPKSCVVVVLLALFFVGGATGQTVSSGALSGVVIDKTNAVVPDASVEISDVTKGTTDLTKTNGEGVYQFSFLRPAKYTLSVTHSGFQGERRSVTVQVGPPVTVNRPTRGPPVRACKKVRRRELFRVLPYRSSR